MTRRIEPFCGPRFGAAAGLRAADGAGFSVAVLVDGSPVPEYAARGRVYVEAVKGKEFTIRLSNPTSERVAVALSVDGRNVVDATRTTPLAASKWILGPGRPSRSRAGRSRAQTARKFFFTDTAKSYAKWLGDTANVGTIEAVFFREKRRPPTIAVKDEAAAARVETRPGRRRRARRRSGRAPKARRPADDYAATGIGERPASRSSGPPSRRIRPGGSRRASGTSSARSWSDWECCPARTTSTPGRTRAASSTHTRPIRTAPLARAESAVESRRAHRAARFAIESTGEDRRRASRLGAAGRRGSVRHCSSGATRRPSIGGWRASVGESDADDMTQDIFLKAYRGLPRFRGEAPPRAWLASIADNAVKNRYRARSRFRRVFAGSSDAIPDLEPPSGAPGPRSRPAPTSPVASSPRRSSSWPRNFGWRSSCATSRSGATRRSRSLSRSRSAPSSRASRAGAGSSRRSSRRCSPEGCHERTLHPARSSEFLSRLHDGELTAAEASAFETHRAECADCREAAAAFARSLAAFRAAPSRLRPPRISRRGSFARSARSRPPADPSASCSGSTSAGQASSWPPCSWCFIVRARRCFDGRQPAPEPRPPVVDPRRQGRRRPAEKPPARPEALAGRARTGPRRSDAPPAAPPARPPAGQGRSRRRGPRTPAGRRRGSAAAAEKAARLPPRRRKGLRGLAAQTADSRRTPEARPVACERTRTRPPRRAPRLDVRAAGSGRERLPPSRRRRPSGSRPLRGREFVLVVDAQGRVRASCRRPSRRGPSRGRRPATPRALAGGRPDALRTRSRRATGRAACSSASVTGLRTSRTAAPRTSPSSTRRSASFASSSAIDLDLGADRDRRGELQELVRVAARVVHDAAHGALAVERLVVEGGDRAHVDRVDGDRAAPRQAREARGTISPAGAKVTAASSATPGSSNASPAQTAPMRERQLPVVRLARERVHLAPPVPRDLDREVRRRAEAEEARAGRPDAIPDSRSER